MHIFITYATLAVLIIGGYFVWFKNYPSAMNKPPVFKASIIKVGDKVGDFIVSEVNPANPNSPASAITEHNIQVVFTGRVTLTGTYSWSDMDGVPMLEDVPVQYTDSLPRQVNEILFDWICLSGVKTPNPKVAYGDSIEVIGESYIYKSYPSEGCNEVKVINLKKR